MDKIKEILTAEDGPILQFFDPSLPTTLMTDASRTGLGYILVQYDQARHTRLITCGSRFLSVAEKNYAVVELECLAVQWAVAKCRLYLAGIEFKILTDHKPLLGIMNGRELEAINNLRLQRIMSKLLGYSFKVKWIAGKNHEIADALSRAPVFQPEEEDRADVLVQTLRVTEIDPALKKIIGYAEHDQDYQAIVDTIAQKKKLSDLPKSHPAQVFKNQWDYLSFQHEFGLITYNERIVVPEEARKGVLETLHIQHTGQTKTFQNARQLYFWPFMKNDINHLVGSCEKCIKLLPSQTTEPRIQTTASRPFEAISVDLGSLDGKDYLIGADRYSGWPMVVKLDRLETSAIIKVLEEWIVDIGKPLKIRSDGGPQFRTEFRDWCEERGIVHELSSPYHPESNGHAEVAVREMKHLLDKTESWEKFRHALLEWRNSPRFDGLSPAQWVFSRRQRTEAIALPSAYDKIPDQVMRDHESKRGQMMEKIKENADSGKRTNFELVVGTRVVIQHPKTKRWTTNGVVLEMKSNRRTYVIEKENGKRSLRNRKFLRPSLNQEKDIVSENDQEETVIEQPKPIIRRSERHCGKKKVVYFKK